MNCKFYQKWLHLYGENELSESRRKQVQQHLQRCLHCQEAAERIELFRQSVTNFNRTIPEMDQPELFANQVLTKLHPRQKHREKQSGWDRWAWLTRPVVRLAMGCVLFSVVSVLFIQEMAVTNRIAALENKMEQSDVVPKSTFAKCLSDLGEFEKTFLNGDADMLITQARQGNLSEKMIVHYLIKFHQLSQIKQFRIVQIYRKLLCINPSAEAIFKNYLDANQK